MGSGSATNDSFDIFFNGTTNGIMIELYANAGVLVLIFVLHLNLEIQMLGIILLLQ
jgi:hypothetical protein